MKAPLFALLLLLLQRIPALRPSFIAAAENMSSSSAVMNATDLRMPTLIYFNLHKPITDAQGIAACSGYCANHSTKCGGWVYVSPAYLPRSKYTGPRCSIKATAEHCYRAPNRPGLFAGAPGATS